MIYEMLIGVVSGSIYSIKKMLVTSEPANLNYYCNA